MDKLEEAVSVVRAHAEVGGCELAEYWNILLGLLVNPCVDDEFIEAVRTEIIGQSQFILSRIDVSVEEQTTTRKVKRLVMRGED
jgi:hypothetical protein